MFDITDDKKALSELQELAEKLLQEKKGGVLLSAHVGNFEIAEVFFREIDNLSQINLVATDSEREDIKVYLESVGSVSKNVLRKWMRRFRSMGDG